MIHGRRHSSETRAEALRLRREERLPLKGISRRLTVPVATIGTWLKGEELTKEELAKQYPVLNRYRAPKKNIGDESALSLMSSDRLTRRQKGAVAETAVLLRLSLLGYESYRSPFDGAHVDWLVIHNGRPVRIAVRWAQSQRAGLPRVSLMRSNGRTTSRYEPDAFDLVVGYSLYLDTAFVWTAAECAENKATVTVSPEAAERWDKILATKA